MKVRKLAVMAGTATAALVMTATPAFAHHCFLVNAAPNSHQGKSESWVRVELAEVLTEPQPDGFGLECDAQVDATLEQVTAAGLPTVFFINAKKTLPDAGGPGKGGIDHIESSPIVAEIGAIAGEVLATVPCGE
jgi:hypothetical protein